MIIILEVGLGGAFDLIFTLASGRKVLIQDTCYRKRWEESVMEGFCCRREGSNFGELNVDYSHFGGQKKS